MNAILKDFAAKQEWNKIFLMYQENLAVVHTTTEDYVYQTLGSFHWSSYALSMEAILLKYMLSLRMKEINDPIIL